METLLTRNVTATRLPSRKRIVLTTMGSLGDLHPYIAIALGLKRHGHDVVMATSRCYEQKIKALDLGFHPIRPDADWLANNDVMRRMMDFRWGTVRVVRDVLLPVLRETYDDTLEAVDGADLLVSHPIAFATRLVAEKTGIPWASTMITPLGFFSAWDVSILAFAPQFSAKLRGLGPAFWGPLLKIGKRAVRYWAEPIDRLASELGLPRKRQNPLGDGHSPDLVMALFSRLHADKQPDWPDQTVVTGFPFYDRYDGTRMPAALAQFLDAGPAPIVFTLGTAASADAGSFYEHATRAAQRLKCRAVLVVGKEWTMKDGNPTLGDGRSNSESGINKVVDGIVTCEYAPFSELFPRSKIIVHHAGIGTTGLAMQSGRPSLVMPFAHDNPDNAERSRRLGIARTISRHGHSAKSLANELRVLIDNPMYARRASQIAEQVQREDGVQTACNALERLLAKDCRLHQVQASA